ncbi:Nucleotide-binding alpha-beta plait [Penicillium soppii]|uniref:Nucleotide-binding alpha-beta plait n=1 Tax=Penicillium soppii TaxID=69789 RepID=UPI00254827CE|nr:Nucleotide-binding alpha-beta plait [Penicillium soppii]KAJ5864229.1 Nucleotide-binding alpha-beta plait [Penicillium soppii]
MSQYQSQSSASAKIYVGNLSWNTTTESLGDAFSQFGNVIDRVVMSDRETGRSRGFGFVTFSSEEEAQQAIEAMNEQDLDGRKIRVNLANARPAGGNGYNGGGRGGFGGGRGGYGGGDYAPRSDAPQW